MSYNYLPIDSKPTNFEQIKNLLAYNQLVSITFNAHERINACRQYLDEAMSQPNAVYYGINTGFGYLQNVQIDASQLSQLQINLLQSHACGLGDEVPEAIVKLMLMLKIKSLSYGHSGVHIDTVKRLMDMYNAEVYPIIYTQGSLGASGDLAPLSHLALPLIGLGEVYYKGQKMQASQALKALRWQPLALQSKEGIALINGTQFMTAYGMHNLIQAEKLLQWANIIAALSIDAFGCTAEAFHPAIQQIRQHKGQQKVAQHINTLLADSQLFAQPKSMGQDPYSFRCIPQVHGASEDTFAYVLKVYMVEVNAVTDNPNIFAEQNLILSGGNFHGQPLALAADFLAIALAEIGSISERRTFQLLSGQRGLPSFLINNPGLHSGLMIPQYVAAGLVSENKQLCTPSCIDTIPSSNNQEDHVSMGANGVVKCKRVLDNVQKILAIELLTAAQALDYKRPARSSTYIENLVAEYRKTVSFNDADRLLHNDLISTINFLNTYQL